MILDYDACLSKDPATGETKITEAIVPAPLQLGADGNISPGPGEPILVYVDLSGLTPGVNSRVLILGADTEAGPFLDEEMSVSVGPKAFGKGGVTFGIPDVAAHWVQIALENLTGTYSAWVVVRTM